MLEKVKTDMCGTEICTITSANMFQVPDCEGSTQAVLYRAYFQIFVNGIVFLVLVLGPES